MSKKSLIIVAILVVLAGLIYAWSVWWSNQPELLGQQATEQKGNEVKNNDSSTAVGQNIIDTSDWQTYKSVGYDYEIKHPANWKVEVLPYDYPGYPAGSLISISSPSDASANITIGIPQRGRGMEAAQRIIIDQDIKLASGSIEAKKNVWEITQKNKVYEFIAVTFPNKKNNDTNSLEVSYLKDKEAEYSPIFDNMIESFKYYK